MRLRWSKWTATTGVVAVFLLVIGVWYLFWSVERQREFESWEAATPMKCAVDFSKSGEYETVFHQVCSSSHGEVVALRISSDNTITNSFSNLLSGMEATIEIIPVSKTNPVDTASAEILWVDQTLDGAIPIFSISSFQKGDYTARIKVTSGAPALTGKTQQLEGRYLLCGMEALPAFIGRCLGIGLLSIGSLCLSLAIFFAAKRSRAQLAETNSD